MRGNPTLKIGTCGFPAEYDFKTKNALFETIRFMHKLQIKMSGTYSEL